jgi:hypothetical protein
MSRINIIMFFSSIMVNRACDFCCNSYKKNPKAGYFRVTQAMRKALGLIDKENEQRDFICGLHFPADSFLDDGRLRSEAVPTFFPSLESAAHDHTYHQPNIADNTDYDGGKVQ